MKLLSYSFRGASSWGALVNGRIVDLQAASQGRAPTLRSALAQFSLDDIETLAASHPATIDVNDIAWLPVIPDAAKIFCIGLNYDEHRIEAKRDKTAQPTVFLRLAASQVGHDAPLLLPPESERFDYEGEIAVIIGRAGRRIAEEDAWDHIAGYAPYNDGSLRDWQSHTTQWTPGKNFPATGGFGPCMVTRGEIADGQELTLTTRLNGEVMQQATTAQLIFSIPRLINYLSTFVPLEPGDVIVTGTPGGVGFKRTPPVFMRAGDKVEVEVSSVGTLSNTVAAETLAPGQA
ncbi:fumarylacetoacetate hydrolase family protein [Polaromonas sp. SM01]|uniref:fumarylacetoacetate hydrolase family protein n=1 Tax=Polaromonas sp. SM01 TaxID=3085630 RepID=UPI002981B3DE|nr:fumarylacetoacetate hydrolase family protein [Polaromonas sp. SM01]MDW5444809.1 fumarylacetoacetate hydrolase family protein [Polaromonas sp. SM01]